MNKTNYYQCRFSPKNSTKYKGDPTNIIARSSWELRVCKWLDENNNVLEWSSEEIIIPYVCITDSRTHRYFPDFKVKFKTGDIYLIEIKPDKETKEPRARKRETKVYIEEVFTYGKNISKWKAAKQYADDRGWKFVIWTENELEKLGLKVTV